jgi:hypothetical protein
MLPKGPPLYLNGPKPYKSIGFGNIQGSKPYKFIGFGVTQGSKPYEFIGLALDRFWVLEGRLAGIVWVRF